VIFAEGMSEEGRRKLSGSLSCQQSELEGMECLPFQTHHIMSLPGAQTLITKLNFKFSKMLVIHMTEMPAKINTELPAL